MAKRKINDAKRAQNHDQKLVKPDSYLETQKAHDKWYNIHEMGKQRGKPRINIREVKKASGVRKHSLRPACNALRSNTGRKEK